MTGLVSLNHVLIDTEIKCMCCNKSYTIKCDAIDYMRWMSGELIQNAMPYLSVDERELMISKICGSCFDEMYNESDDKPDQDV